DSIAAFSVEGENTEQLIVLVERADSADESADAAATEVIRTAVSKNHGIVPDVIEWKAPHEINRTSSGKIARRVAKKHYMAEFIAGDAPAALPLPGPAAISMAGRCDFQNQRRMMSTSGM